MFCCINCFKSKEPKEIISENDQIGNCDFCGSEGIAIIDPIELCELFKPILEYYEKVQYKTHYLDPDDNPLEHGEFLGHLLQNDWEIFSDTIGSTEICNELIEAIFNGTIDANDLWCTIDDRWYVEPDEDQSTWNKFSQYLKTKRRFFFDFEKLGVNELFDQLAFILEKVEFTLPKGAKLWRARLGGKVIDDYVIRPFSKENMGAPPPCQYNQGRGNPPGISYLYAASQERTAVAEKRPGRNSILSLGELETKKDLQLINLAKIPYLDSPFGIEFLAHEIRARNILHFLGKELSRPISVEDPPNEYLNCQFLCEFILKNGYDGVIYDSGYDKGQNYLIFDTNSVEVKNVKLVEVNDVEFSIEFGIVYDIREERLD